MVSCVEDARIRHIGLCYGPIANALGDVTTYHTFMQRAQNWQYLFNPATGYVEPRASDGTFPSSYDHTSANDLGFIEGNSAQYTWMVPYNLHALFIAMGGYQQVVSRLDSFSVS